MSDRVVRLVHTDFLGPCCVRATCLPLIVGMQAKEDELLEGLLRNRYGRLNPIGSVALIGSAA